MFCHSSLQSIRDHTSVHFAISVLLYFAIYVAKEFTLDFARLFTLYLVLYFALLLLRNPFTTTRQSIPLSFYNWGWSRCKGSFGIFDFILSAPVLSEVSPLSCQLRWHFSKKRRWGVHMWYTATRILMLWGWSQAFGIFLHLYMGTLNSRSLWRCTAGLLWWLQDGR